MTEDVLRTAVSIYGSQVRTAGRRRPNQSMRLEAGAPERVRPPTTTVSRFRSLISYRPGRRDAAYRRALAIDLQTGHIDFSLGIGACATSKVAPDEPLECTACTADAPIGGQHNRSAKPREIGRACKARCTGRVLDSRRARCAVPLPTAGGVTAASSRTRLGDVGISCRRHRTIVADERVIRGRSFRERERNSAPVVAPRQPAQVVGRILQGTVPRDGAMRSGRPL